MKYLLTFVAAAMLVGAVASADDTTTPNEKPAKPHAHKMMKKGKMDKERRGDHFLHNGQPFFARHGSWINGNDATCWKK